MALCSYSLPYADLAEFVDLANRIFSVSLGAYLGGIELLAESKVYERLYASMLAVKARHDTFLRTALGASAFPTTYDTGLTAVWAFNLVQQFVVSCPQPLPIIQLPKLTLTSPDAMAQHRPALSAGTTLAFRWDPSKLFVTVDPNAQLCIAIVNQNISTSVFQILSKTTSNTGWVKVPEGMGGAAFACLMIFAGDLTLNDLTSLGTLAGPVAIMLS